MGPFLSSTQQCDGELIISLGKQLPRQKMKRSQNGPRAHQTHIHAHAREEIGRASEKLFEKQFQIIFNLYQKLKVKLKKNATV